MSVCLSKARPSDEAALSGLVHEFHAWGKLPCDIETIKVSLKALLADPALGHAWLIEQDAERIGYAITAYGYSIEFGGRYAFVDELYLRAPYRGAGIGTTVLQQIVDASTASGMRAILIEVDPDNTAAEGLYRKLGFVPRDRYALMIKPLPQA